MQAALNGFLEVTDRTGRSLAVLPENQYNPEGYDQTVRTAFAAPKDFGASPFSRNLVNVAFCHGALFVSDSPGTLTEVIWMHRIGKPSAFFGPAATWESARGQLASAGADHDVLVGLSDGTTDLYPCAVGLLKILLQTLAHRLDGLQRRASSGD